MITPVTKYKKALKRNLRCPGSAKQRLMGRFDAALSAFLEDTPTPTTDELHTAFGPPEEMSRVLMEEVTPEESARYLKKTVIMRITAGVLAAVFLAVTVYVYFFKENEMLANESITIIDEHHVDTETRYPGE